VLIVPVFEGETPRDSDNASALAGVGPSELAAPIASLFDEGEMTGKLDSSVLLQNVGPFSTRRFAVISAPAKQTTLARSALEDSRARRSARYSNTALFAPPRFWSRGNWRPRRSRRQSSKARLWVR